MVPMARIFLPLGTGTGSETTARFLRNGPVTRSTPLGVFRIAASFPKVTPSLCKAAKKGRLAQRSWFSLTSEGHIHATHKFPPVYAEGTHCCRRTHQIE